MRNLNSAFNSLNNRGGGGGDGPLYNVARAAGAYTAFANGGNGGNDPYGDVYYERAGGRAAATAGQRLGCGLCGLLWGPLLLFAGCALLFANEGWAVRTRRSLDEALGSYVEIDAGAAPPAGAADRLVHLTGPIVVSSPASDADFGLARGDAIALTRRVEIYQWHEKKSTTRRKLNNGETEVTESYSYERRWTGSPVSSGGFRHPEGHENIGFLPFHSATFRAEGVALGVYALSDSLVAKIHTQYDVPATEARTLPPGAEVQGNRIYFLEHAARDRLAAPPDPTDGRVARAEATAVGDVRVTFQEVRCATASAVAALSHGTLVPWHSREGPGYDVQMLVEGTRGAHDMIVQAQQLGTFLSWARRAGGALLNLLGFAGITGLVATAADVSVGWIPLVGPAASSIIGLGVCIANVVLASCTSLLVASVAWIYYRPVLGFSMLAGSAGIFYAASRAGGGGHRKF